MGKKKVFVTGMGGYLAGVLCRELDHADWCESVAGMDVKPPLYKYDKAEFRTMDVNAPELARWVAEFKPDVMAHLAFILKPTPDDALMERVNVDGTANVLKAAEAAGVRQALVASSGTAYGAWPDNPVPLKETDELRPSREFKYSADKGRVEELCREHAERCPESLVSVIRPCVVYGPLVNNFLSDLITKFPLAPGLKGYGPPLQFIHEDDVARGIMMMIERDAVGAYNFAPSDYVTMSEVVAMAGKRSLSLPDSLVEPLLGFNWRHQLSEFQLPPSFLEFMRYPWVLDNSKLTDELGYEFRYSTRETVEIMLRAKGVVE